MLQKNFLSNGLRVLSFPVPQSQAVTLLFLVRTGSRFETRSTNGLSHLLEHLLFRGTKSWPKSGAIAQELDKKGGFYNAFTSKEVLRIIIKVAPEDFNLALRLLAEMVQQPLLKKEDLAKEKKVIIEEINMMEDNPPAVVGDLWEKLLYGEQPLGWPIAGSKETLNQIPRSALLSHRKKFFVAANSVLAVAGHLPPELLKAVEKKFTSLARGSSRNPLPARESQSRPGLAAVSKTTDQTHLCLGVRAYDLFSPKIWAAEVLANLLGGMMSSRLFVEVRDKRNLAYYLHTSLDSYLDAGYLVTTCGVNTGRRKEAVAVICREYARLKEKKVGWPELNKAKENLLGHLKLGLETSEQFANYFGEQELLRQKILTPLQEEKEIAKVTPGDILKVAREIFRPERLNLALVGPELGANKEKISASLRL